MAETSNIAWTDATFNPWVGCQRVSQGCVNCYAEKLVTGRMGRDTWGAKDKRQRTKTWGQPLKLNRQAEAAGEPLKVFCASLADVFEDAPVPNEARPDLWKLIAECPWLDFQLLTKRPENIARMLPDDWGDGYGNVWLGTSVEDYRVNDRIEILSSVPAYRCFISYEPAIGPLRRVGDDVDLSEIDWLICGGESGPGHRPMDLTWAQEAKDLCDYESVAFFFKQSSGPRPGGGEDALGAIYRSFPKSLPNTERNPR